MNNLKNQAQGKFIIMINDDIILDKKSIDQAIIYLNANNQAGIIGGRLRDKKGLLTHAGIHFNILNSPYHTLELLVNSSHIFIKRKTKIVPAVTGALMLSKKTILDQINFNELYKVCGEDVELCLDMRQYLKKQIHFFYDFSAIHESASTRKEFPEQQQNNNDKLRLKKRYKRFLKQARSEELLCEYTSEIETIIAIFKYKINTHKGRIHTDWLPLLLINMISLNLLVFKKRILDFIPRMNIFQG